MRIRGVEDEPDGSASLGARPLSCGPPAAVGLQGSSLPTVTVNNELRMILRSEAGSHTRKLGLLLEQGGGGAKQPR